MNFDNYYIERIFKISIIIISICFCLYVVRTFFNTNNPIEFALEIFPTLGYNFLYILIAFGGLVVLDIIASKLFEIFKNN